MQRDLLFVTEMLEAGERIRTLTAGLDAAAVDRDPTVRDALLAAGLRNRIVHGYWSTDTDVLVSTAHDVVPHMLMQLRSVLDELS